ncbi:radical SAM protein [Boudabousia marimammalium]|uniref:Radical SAM core domain-containing protein n=1 Tax=Boudabousia marimammalium TaxID=156892 RepID=A0A1Q5PJX3_9ACTO|nr:radical SAM protein [Boudabousia marimammalium]OKL46233.1 hypothetical protein BM477_07325 [Boudabousia marimammalium]
MRQPQSVGINFSGTCNARCSHCCVSSAPTNRLSIEDNVVNKVIDDLIAHADVYEVGFTGGEPLLRKQRIFDLIKTVSSAGKQTTLTTNGFWGVTESSAREVVEGLESAGLSHLTISWDGYHAPYIKANRIRNALQAAKESRIPCILNMCVSRDDDGFDLLKQLGEATLGVKITRFPVVPCGTGRNIPSDQIIRRPIDSFLLRCPGYELIYHHDGFVYPCCSPPIFDTDMTLGQVGEVSHEEFIRRLERNALLAAIQKFGLSWLRDLMVRVNPRAKVAKIENAVSPCEICALMLSDAETLNMAAKFVIEAVTMSTFDVCPTDC